jgi:hypothetical protein
MGSLRPFDNYRCPLNQLTPAPSGAPLGSPLAGLEPGPDLFGLLDLLIRGTPEEQASGDASHGDRDIEFCGHAEEAVFHGGLTRSLRKREAGGGIVKQLDFFLQGLIDRWVHPGASAYAASFL